MNERQNMVTATAVCVLILVIVFLCPWRIEESGELQWSPVYQPPLSYTRSYDTARGNQGSASIAPEEAHIAIGYYIGEILAVLIGGGVLYKLAASSDNVGEETSP